MFDLLAVKEGDSVFTLHPIFSQLLIVKKSIIDTTSTKPDELIQKLTLNPFHAFFNWIEQLYPPFPENLPAKPPASLFGFVVHYTRPFFPLILVSAVLSVSLALTEVYLFSFIGNLVDWLATSEKETFWETYKHHLIFVGFVALVLLPTLKFFYESTIHQGLLGNFAMRTRWQAHRYLLRQSVEFFQNDFAGRIATKMMQTSLGVRDAVIKVTEVILYIAVYFLGALVMFAASDIRLTIPMIFWLAGYILTMWIFIPKIRRISMEQAEARSMVTGRVVDSYTNITTVKMFAHSDHENTYAQEGMELFLDTVHRQMRLVTILTSMLSLLNGVLIFLVAATSIWLWQLSLITTGSIAFAIGLVMRLEGMSQAILWEISGLFENIGVVQDGIETISNDIVIKDRPDARKLEVTQGNIAYRNIHFNYGKIKSEENQLKRVVDNLSLEIAGGEKIGIVGRSGAGKSTLVNLLLRFYDVEAGNIQVDGQDLRSVKQDSLRSQIGMVSQDTSLLHRSVLDNIRYGQQHATMDDAIAAAKKAHAHEFILDLEDLYGNTGYDAHVGERGVKLSGGQRQRIAIARILLKDAPILVLDEATSALDSEVEAAIQESLYSLMAGKTVIAIAHRLSTIAAMDRLVIMDDGVIVEQGSHNELLRSKGLYSELWARQSGGFLLLSE
ncbi:MAG: ATP-binding cassette domain-containing protein [Gammaproteobacteria bacterium]|nr:ATP-binding cassette domain-containing protein [Gammaproteobacteria bacterium]